MGHRASSPGRGRGESGRGRKWWWLLQLIVELSEISSERGISPGIHYWHGLGWSGEQRDS